MGSALGTAYTPKTVQWLGMMNVAVAALKLLQSRRMAVWLLQGGTTAFGMLVQDMPNLKCMS